MLTIGKLSKEFKLSRSTLIYYDKIELLKPTGRTYSNYRVYFENDVEKLRKIEFYKKTGLSLEEIKDILKSDNKGIERILEKRLEQLDVDIEELKIQQKVITDILKVKKELNLSKSISKEMWVDILRKTGLSEAGMKKWHKAFEKTAPLAHEEFLKNLGIEDNEVDKIRKWSKKEDCFVEF